MANRYACAFGENRNSNTDSSNSDFNPANRNACAFDENRNSNTDSKYFFVGPGVSLLEGPGTEYAEIRTLDTEHAVQVIGQYSTCAWLEVVTSDKEIGWIEGNTDLTRLQNRCDAIRGGTFRPYTGIIKNSQGDGLGELSISNGTVADTVAILAISQRETVMSAYIRAGDSFALKGIPDGTYYLYFSLGELWDGEEFTQNRRNKRFEDKFSFSTDEKYVIWSVTLHPVVGGTAETEEVAVDDFPDVR